MSQQVSPLFFFPAFNTVFWMPLSMLNVFYCFAHPERETAGALINRWKRWAGCHCGFPGQSDAAKPVPVQEGWGMGSLGVLGAGSGGGRTVPRPSTGLTHHHLTAEHGFPALAPSSCSSVWGSSWAPATMARHLAGKVSADRDSVQSPSWRPHWRLNSNTNFEDKRELGERGGGHG